MKSHVPAITSKSVELRALAEEIRRIEGGFGNSRLREHLSTGIDGLDAKLPGRGLAAGAVHELWSPEAGSGLWTMAAWLVRQAAEKGGFILWFDSRNDFYPPAAGASGLDLNRLVLVRPRDRKQMLWGMGHALHSRGVAAVVGSVKKPALAEVRRLQLAAESGGGFCFLLAASVNDLSVGGVASRWNVSGAPAGEDARRIVVEIEKCRGGRAASPLLLEVERGKIRVALSSGLADRPDSPKVADSSAA